MEIFHKSNSFHSSKTSAKRPAMPILLPAPSPPPPFSYPKANSKPKSQTVLQDKTPNDHSSLLSSGVKPTYHMKSLIEYSKPTRDDSEAFYH